MPEKAVRSVFSVRPAYRRRGFATEILRQSLVIARSVGIDHVLVTCDEENLGSSTVIERCGGVFDSVAKKDDGSGSVRRYWVGS